MNIRKKKAVVLGASVTGLMAARVLARHFEEVVVVERDALPDRPELARPRKGVGQGRHNHNVTPRGTLVLSRLFPRLLDDLRSHGASVCGIGGEGTWVVAGHRIRRVEVADTQILASRPLLDGLLVSYMREDAAVTLRDRVDVCGLVHDDGGVKGVRIIDRRTGASEVVESDLVVDATGRGSRTPRWLTELGYEAPEEESLEVRVSYTTRVFRRRPDDLGGDRFVYVSAKAPDRPRGCVAFAIDGDRWTVLLFGYGERPPTDLEGFRRYASALGVPELDAIVQGSEPLGDAATYNFPRSTRRRYDLCRALPSGLIVVGDAFQSTNPSWGLGITSAALQIEALEPFLRRDEGPVGWYRRALRASSSVWQGVAARDRAFDVVPGDPPPPARWLGRLVDALMLAARRDAHLARLTMGFVGQMRGPLALLRPDRLLRIAVGALLARRRRRRALTAGGGSDMLPV